LRNCFEDDWAVLPVPGVSFYAVPALISILDFAYLLGFQLLRLAMPILLRYEADNRTAVAACNFW
jgi:hypothetical protein